jgi:predicted nucleic acid-binding protein
VTKKIILDSSSLINLINSEVFDEVLKIPSAEFYIEGMVRRETVSHKDTVDVLLATGKILLIDENSVSGRRFLEIIDTLEIGDGESECIVIAEEGGFLVCSDDRKARTATAKTCGDQSLTGSIGLLKQAVSAGLIDTATALAAHAVMCEKGAFLPPADSTTFA